MVPQPIITLLNGRLRYQTLPPWPNPSAISVWLAASVPVQAGDTVLDAGCGGGAVGLCLLARQATAQITGIDREATLTQLATQNAALNGWGAQWQSVTTDLLAYQLAQRFQHTVANPPYYNRTHTSRSPKAGWEAAHGATAATATDWLLHLLNLTAVGGTCTILLHANQVAQILELNLAPHQASLAWLHTHPTRTPKNAILRLRCGQTGALQTQQINCYDTALSTGVLRQAKALE